jgi:acetoacetyl-CoA synthetase
LDRELQIETAEQPDRAGSAGSPPVDQLIDIWQSVFHISPLGPDDDFFELGGDSLLAVGLFLEIERRLGVRVPLTTIYDAPTIGALAEQIALEKCPVFSPLVCLRQGGAPLFIVHGIGGSVMEFAKLGAHLDEGHALYAIQPKGIDGNQEPLRSIDEMAEYYLDALRSVQPAGPYRLGGYSFGGIVAVEMARRLKHAGEPVELVVLIDAYAHPLTWPLPTRLVVLTNRAKQRALVLARQGLRETTHQILATLRARIVRRRPSASAAPAQPRPRRWLRKPTIEMPPVLQAVYDASEIALENHTPRAYPGRIVFLRAATTNPVFPPDPRTVWGRLARGMDVYTIAGDHLSMMNEHVADVAAVLSRLLARRTDDGPRGTRGLRSLLSGFHLFAMRSRSC